jgi:tRNA pseudouridine38-40 synthase
VENQSPSASAGITAGAIKLKLVIAYDGTNYSGWQVQKIGLGVQQLVEEALAKLFSSKPRLHSSSRTDTGVHALGMVAHMEITRAEFKMSLPKLALAVNAHLPEDIRVMSAEKCGPEFHARFDASGKQYRYFVWNSRAHNPILRRIAWHVPKSLDLTIMRRAAQQFVGKHDFAAFTANRGGEIKSTVRNVTRCQIRRSGALLTFIIEADGFLYKMCRGIVGTLIQIGQGKFDGKDVPRLLACKDRRVAGMNAPAHGLVLWKVMYPQLMHPRRAKAAEIKYS